ncbi:protein SPO16 homolog isoform X4 [Latimeria chalumnae]|uniref:protein SPO16 homolog isoform X4 n=1 Tax=Latimeria chalumnae TaxID=7897 RepID=UPI0003C1A0C8|nr:PREDICTED: uncharacterized protein C1orf146 homolog isoform X4 [Latimeria chalumnae]|eukprot:XP_006001670.1 PREDICTED: uncharacterized protein C1orf146 homolog isoform X4 [Latimeria chalumnae]
MFCSHNLWNLVLRAVSKALAITLWSQWLENVILSHEVATSLISQQHRVRFSDTVEEGSIIFSLSAALHETREWETMIRIQQRFLGSNLRIIPVHNTNDIVKSILTIAKATCKPAVDNIWCRMVMATAQITDRSLVWEMLHKLQLGEE